MDCLDNIVGVKHGCGDSISSSNLWLQDLAGFSLKVADMAADEETISGMKLIEEKKRIAQASMVAHLRNEIQSRFSISSVLENDTIGFYRQGARTIAAESGKLKGIKVKIQQYPYLEYYAASFSLLLNYSGSTNIFVYDLTTGKLLDTLAITTVSGEPISIAVNKAYLTGKQRLVLGILYDASLGSTVETSINALGSNDNCDSCSGGYGNSYMTYSGIKIDSSSAKIEGNTQATTGTSGLSVSYSLNCSVEQFICNMAGSFAWPFLHKWGAEIMKEAQFSRRLNSIINIDKKENEALRAEYENEYMASMSAILQNLKLPNDICFRCNSTIKTKVRVP